MMILINRVRITIGLALATFTSLIDLCFPEIIPETTKFLVKNVGIILYNNGLTSSSEVCEQVSASTGDSRAMDETSGSESERNDEQEAEHITCDELKSNGSENDGE